MRSTGLRLHSVPNAKLSEHNNKSKQGHGLQDARLTWHLASDSCCLLGETRRGKARSGTKQLWVWLSTGLSVEECHSWYFRQSDCVTCQRASLDRKPHVAHDPSSTMIYSSGVVAGRPEHLIWPRSITPTVKELCSMADVAELSERGVDQNDSGAQSNTRSSFRHDLSPAVHLNGAITAVEAKGGTVFALFTWHCERLRQLNFYRRSFWDLWSFCQFIHSFLGLDLQPNDNTTIAMAACNLCTEDSQLCDAEWYWANISRYHLLNRFMYFHDHAIFKYCSYFIIQVVHAYILCTFFSFQGGSKWDDVEYSWWYIPCSRCFK